MNASAASQINIPCRHKPSKQSSASRPTFVFEALKEQFVIEGVGLNGCVPSSLTNIANWRHRLRFHITFVLF